ncbi:MAG: DUF167 family protein [Methyloceanibacter sp.]|nr:DUF167 family protein [Methyloceanibacter sp.]
MGDRARGRPAPQLKIRQTETGIAIPVRLSPRSAYDALEGVEDSQGDPVLKARVRAVPESGNANRALEALIANWLDVPQSSVAVIRGAKARIKVVAIVGSPVGLSALVATRLAAFCESPD